MRRGDIVTIALQGDFGKPRPALVMQADAFNDSHATITVALISSTSVDAPLFRIRIEPKPGNGLNQPCQVQVDKMMTVKREKIGAVIGCLDGVGMLQVNRALVVWLGLG